MKIKGILLIALAFSAPISIFATDLFVFSLAAVWLFEGQFKPKWKKISTSPWLLSLLFLFVAYALGLMWGNYHHNAAWIFQKTALLLLLPILYTLNFSQKDIKYSVFAFLSATSLSAIIALLINIGWIKHLFKYSSIFTKNWHNPAFISYTDHNIFLAFTLLICFFIMLNTYQNKRYKWVLLSIIVLSILSLYGEKGRAGQIAFIFISLIFSFLAFWNNKRNLVLSILGLIAINISAYYLSSNFSYRVESTRSEVTELEKTEENNINSRYYLFNYTLDKIKEKPLLGFGTGSFVEEFSSISPHAKKILADEHKTPHNNYLFICFELGIVGLMVFLSIFYFQLKAYKSLSQGYFRMIFPAIFLVIMLSDTYFQNHNTAALYCYLSFVFSFYSFK